MPPSPANLPSRIVELLVGQSRLAHITLAADFTILDASANLAAMFNLPQPPAPGQSIFEVMDALVGVEPIFAQVLHGEESEYRLEYLQVGENPPRYINLYLWRLSETSIDGLLMLIENVTAEAVIHQHSVQSRNELRLLRIELQNANQVLEQQALFDALTELPNRRYFEKELVRYEDLYRRHRGALAFAFIDFDDFKQLNDHHGHLAGDDCLRLFAGVLKESIRSTDFAARYGGEEFCLLMPLTTAPAAQVVMQRVLHNLKEKLQNRAHPFTISVGIAAMDENSDPRLLSLVKSADDALYKAKRNGKNQIWVAG